MSDSKDASDPDGADSDRPGDGRSGRWNLPVVLASVLVLLAVIAAFGYFGGLGPLSSLSTKRSLEPPETLGGLHRITDEQTRQALQLDQVADAVAQTNKGNDTAVEVYGDVGRGSGLFVVIALRGKIDIDKTVADSGATPEQVRKVGDTTCTTLEDQVVTCYRGSNTLTVMVRLATPRASVDKVAPMTDEAFDAFK